MSVLVEDRDLTIHVGDVRDVLPTLEDESVDCVATSPPFYALRDYGVDGQIGLEATPDEWVAELVAVFRECRRILRSHGTLWVEIGTSYASNRGGGGMTGSTLRKGGRQTSHSRAAFAARRGARPYGSDDKEPRDSPGSDSACLCLCDECLAAILNHRGRSDDTVLLHARSEQPVEQTDPSSATLDGSGPETPPLVARASTIPDDARAPQPEWTCDVCGAPTVQPPTPLRTFVPDVPASARMAACMNDTVEHESASRSQDTDAEGTAWVDYKTKDLILTPFLLAEALRRDGWYLRQVIIWSKPNGMPESARDRCTTSHSYVLLLAKNPRYFFDMDAIAEPAAWERWGDQTAPKYEGTDTAAGWIGPKTKSQLTREARERSTWESGRLQNGRSSTPDGRAVGRDTGNGMKNARSVWTIPTRGYSGAHFATWPEALAEQIIKAGCPEWVCGTCGKPRERIVEEEYDTQGRTTNGQKPRSAERRGFDVRQVRATATVGWTDCGHDNYQPGVVLDPFFGAGTTGLVARRLGRRCVGVELNEDYARMAAERCQQLSLLAEL